jgi:YD repeat-containing protein
VPSSIQTNPVGEETTENFYPGGYDYKVQQAGFNAFGESKEEVFYLPSGSPAAGLGSSLAFTTAYENINGSVTQQGFPAGGGLPTESDKYTYTGPLELLKTVGSYDQNATYTGLSQLATVTLGAGTSTASVTDAYDPLTGDPTSQIVSRSTSPTAVDNTSYTYSPAGDLTAETDERNGSTSQEETQCFAYTTNGQLAQAWTATDACKAVPTTSSHSTVGDGLGASSEYDEAWTFNALGEPKTKATLATATGTYSSTAYGYSSTALTELTSAATTGATTSSYSYGYTDGEQTTRDAASGNQTLAWNGQGELTGADVTSSGASVGSYVYDGEGNLFAQTDSSGTTIYLPGEQLTISGSTVSGVRFYDLPGGVTADRTGSGNAYGFEVASDQHGTNTLVPGLHGAGGVVAAVRPVRQPAAPPRPPARSPAAAGS